MAAQYKKGQKVIIIPVETQHLSPRVSAIEAYAGQSGIVTDFYWMNLHTGVPDFYIYTVRMEKDDEEVVVYEDELKACVE